MAARNYGQYCGVVSALELVGERWSLLIVRDLLVGPRRYTDLKAGLPRIPTNILSTRLKELQEGGVVRRVPLLGCIVYELTDFGRGLEDVVLALGRWGFQAMGEPGPGDIVTAASMTIAFRTSFRRDAASRFPRTAYLAHIGTVSLSLDVSGEELAVSAPAGATTEPDLEFAAGPGIRSLISGEVPAGDAIERGVVHILSGDPALLERFTDTFSLADRR